MPHAGYILDGEEYTFDQVYDICDEHLTFAGFPKAALLRMKDRNSKPDVLSPSGATYCPRQRILKATHDYYLEPEKLWGAAIGTAVHEWLEDDSEWSERKLSTELPNGITLTGTIDHFDPDTGTIVDFKTIHSFQRFNPETKRRGPRPLPDDRHVVQLQLYALLLRYNGYQVNYGCIWYVRQDKEATRRLCNVPIWETIDMEDLAERLSASLVKWKETGELPPPYMPGDDDYWMCNYCPVNEVCAQLALEEDVA